MESRDEIMEEKYAKEGKIVSRKIAGETILVPVHGELANMQQIFALDEVAEYIWQKLDDEKKLSEILDDVLVTFEAHKDDAKKDLLEFIEELKTSGLIRKVK